MLITFWVRGTTLGLPEVDPDVKKTKEMSEPQGRSSTAGNEELTLTSDKLSMASMEMSSALGNGQVAVRCSKEGSYKIILESAFSINPKMISGCVNMSEHMWGM